MATSQQICIIGSISVLILAVIVLFACSFSSVGVTEWAFKYNAISKTVYYDEVYDGGLFFIALWNSFIRFPVTHKTIEFSDWHGANAKPLKTRTKEGLSLGLHISFQYQLIKKDLAKLYEISNVNYEQTFIRIARDVILQEAGNYAAPSYWSDRGKIGQNMNNLLDSELQNAYARCVGFQLLQVTLPDSYEDSIVTTQVEVQKTQMELYRQQAQIIQKEIDVLIAGCQQSITVINADANAQGYYLVQMAQATAKKNWLQVESTVYNLARNELQMDNNYLNQYLYLQAILEQKEKTVVVGMDKVILQVSGQQEDQYQYQ